MSGICEAFAQPLPGLWLCVARVRWLAPPANFRQPSGLGPEICAIRESCYAPTRSRISHPSNCADPI
jgi:hypothetical protein